MKRTKIDYGIDLGTTNSSICRMEVGVPVIKKTDVLKDVLPSCVAFTPRGGIRVGDSAYALLRSDKARAARSGSGATSAFVEFKRAMGSDTVYDCAATAKSYTPEQLSAEVLKTLRSFITDEEFDSVVITVPAKFGVRQKTATMEAARLAGFRHIELLQEPIAAAIAYGAGEPAAKGTWLVFDFGGGTFDAALISVDGGVMTVFDTEGDNYLGGKNLDYAIVDGILIPALGAGFAIDSILGDEKRRKALRDALKPMAEDLKNRLSFKDREELITDLDALGDDDNGEPMELDLSVTRAQLEQVMEPVFARAVDLCRQLIQRNDLAGKGPDKIILVGGPTHAPLIRRMLAQELGATVDTSIDPMTAVAAGAALYASTLDIPADIRDEVKEPGTVLLDITYRTMSACETEWVSIARRNDAADCLLVRRADGAWTGERTDIAGEAAVLELPLVAGKPNVFSIEAFDAFGRPVKASPDRIVIRQGAEASGATLPFHIGIAIYDPVLKKDVFKAAAGLEKDKPLPATGRISGRRLVSPLLHGNPSSLLRIPIYQADYNAEDKPVALYEPVGEVVVSGNEVSRDLEAGSPVEIRLHVDRSEQITMEVLFPSANETVSKHLDTSLKNSNAGALDFIAENLPEVDIAVNRLADNGADVQTLKKELDRLEAEHFAGTEPLQTSSNLKSLMARLDEFERVDRLKAEKEKLAVNIANLRRSDAGNPDPRTHMQITNLITLGEKALEGDSLHTVSRVSDRIENAVVQLNLHVCCMNTVRMFMNEFDNLAWFNRQKARRLVDEAWSFGNDSDDARELERRVIEIYQLLPNEEVQRAKNKLL